MNKRIKKKIKKRNMLLEAITTIPSSLHSLTFIFDDYVAAFAKFNKRANRIKLKVKELDKEIKR